MNSKNILLIIVFVFLINIAIAANLRPEIIVTFYEEVDNSTITVSLTDSLDKGWGLELIGSNNPTFVYRPVKDLAEGFYTIRAQARDLQGTLGPVIELSFPIPPMEITIVEPRFGITSISPFDFIIETDRWAVCKYSFLDKSYGEMGSTFSTGNNQLHEEKDFTSTGRVYVKCKDKYDKINGMSFILRLDDSPPGIVYKHAEDVAEFPISTDLVVRTDDEAVCKYYCGDSSMSYDSMEPFSGYDEGDESSYNTEHSEELEADDLMDHKVNRCYLRCKNKAGLLSAMEYVDINVDTGADPVMTINSPERYISDTTPLFNVTTNKDATCSIAGNSKMDGAVGMLGTEKEHIRELSSALSSGTYTYYIQCIWDEGPIVGSVTFSIDGSKPNMTYVNMLSPLENRTDKTYKDDELCAEWKAEDGESAISLYAYYVYWDKSPDELIEKGTKSPRGDNEYCVDVDLNDSQKYYIRVSAQNSVGLWSDNMSSSSIEVDTSLAPAGCYNKREDGDETDVDCGGDCDGCANGDNCLLGSDCDSGFCNASNKCAEPRCDDSLKNGYETDVDCGGSKCKKCDVGKYCNENRDCKTNNCDASTGKCAEVLDECENGELDPRETDIDCGGNCPGCGVGKSCDSDSDCITTAECKDGVCTLRRIDSDGDGIFDGEDNCPDIANGDQADVDDDGIGDECDLDSDNDELPDSFEQQYFDCVTCAEPEDDPDKDGLTNLEEYGYNTNPTKWDTDGDGYSDKEEIDKETDPLDPSSHPKGGFLKYLFVMLGLAVLGAGGYFGYKVLMEKKPFIPPRAAVAKKAVSKPVAFPKRPMMLPRMGPPGRTYVAARPMPKPPITKKPTTKNVIKAEKPKLEVEGKKEEEDIFKRLSDISKAERAEQVEKHMKSLKMTDRELKERIGRLKKELKVK